MLPAQESSDAHEARPHHMFLFFSYVSCMNSQSQPIATLSQKETRKSPPTTFISALSHTPPPAADTQWVELAPVDDPGTWAAALKPLILQASPLP